LENLGKFSETLAARFYTGKIAIPIYGTIFQKLPLGSIWKILPKILLQGALLERKTKSI